MRHLRANLAFQAGFLVFLLVLSGLASGLCQEASYPKEIFPQADTCTAETQPFDHFRCSLRSRPLGYCFKPDDLISDISGFSGDIGLFVCIDAQARIKSIEVLYHSETPGYGDKLKSLSFLGQFKGKSIYDDFLVGGDVDGISGATITAKSFCRIAKQASQAAFQVLSKRKDKILSPGGFSLSLDELIVALMLIFSVSSVLRGTTFLRPFFLIIVIVYLGLSKNLFISIFNLKQILQSGFPPFAESISWYLLFGLSILGAVFLGRFYCGWLCPFGALQELVSRFGRKKRTMSYRSHARLLKLKYYLLIAGVFLFLFFKRDHIFKLEPFIYIFRAYPLGLFSYGIFMVLLSLAIPRFFCRYLCLVGAFFGILSRFSLVKYRSMSPANCPVGAIGPNKNIIDNECLRCNACQRRRINRNA